MSKLTEVPLASSSNVGRNSTNSREQLINLMAVQHTGLPKNRMTLQGTAGFSTMFDLDEGIVILGVHAVKEIVYFVTNKEFFKLDENGLSSIGILGFDKSVTTVSIEDNGFSIVFVAGRGFTYDISSDTLSNYDSDPAYYPSDTVSFLDGYFIFNKRGTMQFFISDLYSTALDASKFASKEANPDDLIGCVVSNRTLWLIGKRSTEAWSNIGAVNFPFLRVTGAVQEVGTSSFKSISKILDSIFFLGTDGAVYQSSGYRLSKISTESIEFFLRKQAIKEAEGFTYSEEGHNFYCLTINGLDTYVYDLTTGLWHNRSSKRVGRWRVKNIVQSNYSNENIGIDFVLGKIYRVDLDIHTEDDIALSRVAYSVPFHNGVSYVSLNEYQISMKVNFLTEPIKEGKIYLQFSDDGGNTWSNLKEALTGKLGDFNKRVVFRRLGRFRQRTFKIIYQEPTQLQILGTYVRLSNIER
jgi:hypothetical protein